MDAKEFGAYLRSERKRAGLNQIELAERVGCSQRFISELERGKTTAELGLSLRVADALSLEVGFRRRRAQNGQVDALQMTLARAQAKLHGASKPRPKLSDYLSDGV